MRRGKKLSAQISIGLEEEVKSFLEERRRRTTSRCPR
jgi:hypothetical protein